ncbi:MULTISPECIES: glycosyl hydrolase family 31 [unclassified Anabaena]|uniref:glycosyl hydrolase family 31 n=1 Tax=unclassified Anabaena TaxID=2619674 RepID=UPI001446DD65|nr:MULTISPECIES: glycosyl hydrolase family 31 [unclassified Anabaena]MTJ09850.1 glycosyl hydrolase family 31 [Anabaena sp. UHCC 0204]MTJ53324.1 glycosyl hydrolase family 31 [Anabaena sp. UHCC 0253]
MTSGYLAIVKDGKIELLDSVSIPEGTKVFIIPILPEDNNTEERENWESFSLNNLNQCYVENEPEYILESIKEYNPNYESNIILTPIPQANGEIKNV